ncbi:BON domain-containing protein [Nannocystis exedens]|uniref:BON domain-containing protein n=3 Tax=Nannocystis exedens TaxID=54 RepID=A0A1I2CXX8_9BACT|nr:BON domain-containing protein [Nannocystis exedens]
MGGHQGYGGQYGSQGMGGYGGQGMGGYGGQGQYGQQGFGGQGQYGQQGMSGPGQYSQQGYGSQGQYGQGQYGQGQYGQGQYGQGQYGGQGSRMGQGYGGGYGEGYRGFEGGGFQEDMPRRRSFGEEGRGMGGMGGRMQERGRFAGRGPKGYRRSDDRITEEICEALTRHPSVDASEIEVKVQQGVVSLSGTVDDRETKRLIEDLSEDISGVREVQNQIRVSHGQTGQSQIGQTQAGQSQGEQGQAGRTQGEQGQTGRTQATGTTTSRNREA